MLLLLPVALTASPSGANRHSAVRAGSYAEPCTGITLSASYLADAGAGEGPGFLFRIDNRSAREIRLVEPVPSSVDWYARVGNHWLWRASAGQGGALVDALRPAGLMFAYTPSALPDPLETLTVPARDSREWTMAIRNHPVLSYRPSCAMCNYYGESEYQAIFAYAWLPGGDAGVPDLLRCGLRSAPVPMPPHPSERGGPQAQ